RTVPGGGPPETEVRSGHDGPGTDPSQHRLGEVGRSQLRDLRCERADEHLPDACLGLEKLEPPLEAAQQLNLIPEHETWMGPERHHGRGPADRARRLQYQPMPVVNPVEAPDCHRPLPLGQLLDAAGDDHSRASASSDGMKRSGSAWSMENGPISSR